MVQGPSDQGSPAKSTSSLDVLSDPLSDCEKRNETHRSDQDSTITPPKMCTDVMRGLLSGKAEERSDEPCTSGRAKSVSRNNASEREKVRKGTSSPVLRHDPTSPLVSSGNNSQVSAPVVPEDSVHTLDAAEILLHPKEHIDQRMRACPGFMNEAVSPERELSE